MREPAAGLESPAPPSPSVSPSPGSQDAGLTHAPPQIPDHELLQPIGRGAYGNVWLARNVMGTLRAVKVVHRRDFGDEHPFDREFRGIQKFEPISRSHPGLVNILQIGRNEAEGYFYYVMELADAWNAEGRVQNAESGAHSGTASPRADPGPYQPRTLRSELKLCGRLPFDECLQFGLTLTSALEHLHSHGLVHRDVKPSNIIFVNGQPKLADIGLVAGVDEARSFVGTEGYIPPEGPGKPQADLYSLGIVLYVMSTGKHHDAFPEPLADLASDQKHQRWLELNAIIHKACHADPRERYQTAEEMHTDLARLQAGKSVRRQRTVRWVEKWIKRASPILALAVALVLGVPWAMRRQAAGPAVVPAEKASVFVLPFRSEGSNEVPGDLCGRITDTFIDSLALIDGVRRSPRKSGWAYQDETTLRRSLAETNDMRHILTGRVSGSRDALTLTLRLHERGKDQPAWTQSFSGTTNEVIALERRGLAQMVQVLGCTITQTEQQRIDQLLANNLEALGWMRQAFATYQRKAGTQAGYTEVQSLCQKALDLDSKYADAAVWHAFQYRNLSQDRAAAEVWPAVCRSMSAVLEQDDTHAIALDELAAYALIYNRDWVNAYEFSERERPYRAKQIALCIQALFYRTYGWLQEAQIVQRQAEQTEVIDIDMRFHMAASRWVERRYAEGAKVARRTLELYPGHAEGFFWLAHCLVAQGEFEGGLQAIDKAQEVWKKQEMTALKGYAYAKMSQTNEAQRVLDDLMELQRTAPYLQPYFVARVYAAVGDDQKALDWLEKADSERSEYLLIADLGGLRTDPAWDGLQNEPRYWRLCERLGLGRNQWPRPKPERLPLPR